MVELFRRPVLLLFVKFLLPRYFSYCFIKGAAENTVSELITFVFTISRFSFSLCICYILRIFRTDFFSVNISCLSYLSFITLS